MIKKFPPKYQSKNMKAWAKSAFNLKENLKIYLGSLDQEQYEKDMADYPFELEDYQAWLNDLGFIYEYYDSNQSPMAINGKPVFFSMRLMCKEDTKKMLEFYHQYKEIRETVDNF
jgi:hypothetical protein